MNLSIKQHSCVLADQLDIIAPLLLCLKHILVFFVNTMKLSHDDCWRCLCVSIWTVCVVLLLFKAVGCCLVLWL